LDNLTVIIPFRDGHQFLAATLASLPPAIPVIVVDDVNPAPPVITRPNTRIVTRTTRGYFSGACNTGFAACQSDVLILNQDLQLHGNDWQALLEQHRVQYGLIGDGVFAHPAHKNGYVQGTFMFIRRDVLNAIGGLNQVDFPLWGATAEFQLRACRAGFEALPTTIPGMEHAHRDRYGNAIENTLKAEPEHKSQFIRTPPLISVIVPCFNYGRFLSECLDSLLAQTFQATEIIIIDDASMDNTAEIATRYANPWTGVHYLRNAQNMGLPASLNAAIAQAHGKYITVVSADDRRTPDALEQLYRAIENDPQAIACDDIQEFDKSQRKLRLLSHPEQMPYKNQMHAGILYPKVAWKAVGGYPHIAIYGREDWAFNLALWQAGYCPVHIDNYGYEYRRHGGNRSTRNAGDVWRARFLEQMQALYPKIYTGGCEMCCGGKSIKGMSLGGKGGQVTGRTVPAQPQLVLLEYMGPAAASETWWGPSRQKYEFGRDRQRGYVQPEDVDFFLQQTHNNHPLFRKAPPLSMPPLTAAAAQKINPGASNVVHTAPAELLPKPFTPQAQPLMPAPVLTPKPAPAPLPVAVPVPVSLPEPAPSLVPTPEPAPEPMIVFGVAETPVPRPRRKRSQHDTSD
jgi:GT2 family glycosyltransferase